MKKYKNRSRSRSRSRSAHKHRHNHKKRIYSDSSEDCENSLSSSEPKYKVEETKILCIENCNKLQAIERVLVEASIKAGTSVPDDVEQREQSVFAKYPSIEASSIILNYVKNTILVEDRKYKISFYPYRKIDVNASYDWYCEQCDYKNFARRNRCYRCETEKTQNCRLNYSSQPTTIKVHKEDNINNCSLMIRGSVITEVQEEILLDLFQTYAPIKDIRMIKNKMTGQMKDFAFIQFFSPEEAAVALKKTSSSEFRIKGEKVSVMYSRNKSDDDYAKPLPYEKRERRRQMNKKEKKEPVQNYYKRQRQIYIQQQKQRPLITLQQLKEKRQQQLKKQTPVIREMTEQQNKRRQAQLLAKQWEKEVKIQNSIMYICALCRRKFKGEEELKGHQSFSQLHKFKLEKQKLSL